MFRAWVMFRVGFLFRAFIMSIVEIKVRVIFRLCLGFELFRCFFLICGYVYIWDYV